MQAYSFDWTGSSVTILKKTSKPIEIGEPLQSRNYKMSLVREHVNNKQGIVIGCVLHNLDDSYWTWLSLTSALLSVFGYGVEPPSIELLVSDPTGLVHAMYENQHKKSFGAKNQLNVPSS